MDVDYGKRSQLTLLVKMKRFLPEKIPMVRINKGTINTDDQRTIGDISSREIALKLSMFSPEF
jgi:hypothetical protein